MEIKYCSECRKRVSSVDEDAGSSAEGKFLCGDCVKAAGLAPADLRPIAEPARKRPGSGPRAVSRQAAPRAEPALDIPE